MILPGLVSVTFRALSPAEICRLCERAKLRCIEWGGDVHVPPDRQSAPEVRRMSADAGLEICAYGSYFHVGDSMDSLLRCMDAACALGAPLMRIWCGNNVISANLSGGERAEIVDGLLAACDAAKTRNLILAPEFHGGTLTDSLSSAERLLTETACADNLRFYWQPRWDWPAEETLRALALVRPRMAHAHVFSWRHEGTNTIRLPLSEGEFLWKRALPLLDGHRMLLEFVQNDDPNALLRDAETLRSWLGEGEK